MCNENQKCLVYHKLNEILNMSISYLFVSSLKFIDNYIQYYKNFTYKSRCLQLLGTVREPIRANSGYVIMLMSKYDERAEGQLMSSSSKISI